MSDTISIPAANFVGFVVGFFNVLVIRLIASSLPPRYPLESTWYNYSKESFESMTGQKLTRRQKDISRLLREKKYNPPQRPKKDNPFPGKKRDK